MQSEKIIDYKLVSAGTGKSSDENAKLVVEFLKQSWELYGSPYIHNNTFLQPMLKREKIN